MTQPIYITKPDGKVVRHINSLQQPLRLAHDDEGNLLVLLVRPGSPAQATLQGLHRPATDDEVLEVKATYPPGSEASLTRP